MLYLVHWNLFLHIKQTLVAVVMQILQNRWKCRFKWINLRFCQHCRIYKYVYIWFIYLFYFILIRKPYVANVRKWKRNKANNTKLFSRLWNVISISSIWSFQWNSIQRKACEESRSIHYLILWIYNYGLKSTCCYIRKKKIEIRLCVCAPYYQYKLIMLILLYLKCIIIIRFRFINVSKVNTNFFFVCFKNETNKKKWHHIMLPVAIMLRIINIAENKLEICVCGFFTLACGFFSSLFLFCCFFLFNTELMTNLDVIYFFSCRG